MIRFMIAMICALLNSHSAFASDSTPERLAADTPLPERCAVVAIVNSVARLTYVGFTAFGNERLPEDVKALGFAELLEERIVSALKSRLPSIKVVDLGHSADLRFIEIGVDDDPSSRHARSVFNQSKQIQSIAASQGHDCLIAVSPAPALFLGELVTFGLGLYSRGPSSAVSAFSGLLMIRSLPDGKLIASRRTSNVLNAQKGVVGDRVAAIELDGVSWRDPDRPSAKVLHQKAVQDFRGSLDRLAEIVAGNVTDMFPVQ